VHKPDLNQSPTIKIEISNIVKSLPGYKTAGNDEVSASVVKPVAMSVVKPIRHVFNLIFYLGQFAILDLN